jgi:L-threonylcarbamoyladenylate synthase
VRVNCDDPQERAEGIRQASIALRRGDLVVLPTDTVYGIAADAFSPTAVDRLLRAKGRGRDMPVPVLVASRTMLAGVVDDLGPGGEALADALWPGALTLVVRHRSTLGWDLGDTRGTVAVRVPLHPVALDVIASVGPLAVSSANLSGAPAATTALMAAGYFADQVAVYLEAGPTDSDVASTIVDLTGERPRLRRAGPVPLDRLRELAPDLVVDGEPAAAGAQEGDGGWTSTVDRTAGDQSGPTANSDEDGSEAGR